MLNKVVLCGRLTRDPEYKVTSANNVGYCNFSVAVDRDLKDSTGTKQTDFIDCTAWRKSAEYLTTYQKKGSMVIIEGRLTSRKWKDTEGNNRTSWFVEATNVYGVGDRNKQEDSGNGYQMPAMPYLGQTPMGANVHIPDGGDYAILADEDTHLPF